MSNIVDDYRNATKKLQLAVSQTPQRIAELNKVIQRADWEEQDLLHLAELDNFNASEGYKIAKMIQKARLKRRDAKDELDELQGIKKIMNNNSKFEAHVNLLNKNTEDEDNKKAKRKYNVRVRTDLSKRFEKISSIQGKG